MFINVRYLFTNNNWFYDKVTSHTNVFNDLLIVAVFCHPFPRQPDMASSRRLLWEVKLTSKLCFLGVCWRTFYGGFGGH